jgi:RimJ/RimL family protein N-acetyltransferase
VTELGFLRVAVRTLGKLAHRLVGLRVLILLELDEAALDRSLLAPDAAFTSRFLSADEIRAFAGLPENRMPARFVERALATGDLCYGVLDGGELASFGWYARTPTPAVGEVVVGFDARDAYMYHGYTKPAYRGRRLHGLGLARALLALAERGVPRVVSAAEATNWATRRSARRVGFRQTGWVVRIGWRRHAVVWCSPGCARAGMRVDALRENDELFGDARI